MLNSILQTLAEILAGGTTLGSTEQIDFSHPSSLMDSNRDAFLNLYLYDVRVNKRMPNAGRQVERSFDGSNASADIRSAPSWFDVSILITARDRTVLGEHNLLSDVLSLLLRYRLLREEFLTSDLRGYGNLSLSVTNDPPIDVASLWSSLSLSIRPAIYLTVTVPLNVWRKATVPLVTERQFGVKESLPAIGRSETVTRQVAIAGIIKNAFNSKPLKRVRVVLEGTEKSVSSDNEGYFFFENLRSGNYALQFKRFGYQTQTCNVLVDGDSCAPKEVFLEPSF
jgi:Pvc16 N-terminal domain/CarboxypepD_reg-like domain